MDRQSVTAEENQNIEPALKGALYGGIYTPSDFTGDIHKLSQGLPILQANGRKLYFRDRSQKMRIAEQVTLWLSKKNGSTFDSISIMQKSWWRARALEAEILRQWPVIESISGQGQFNHRTSG